MKEILFDDKRKPRKTKRNFKSMKKCTNLKEKAKVNARDQLQKRWQDTTLQGFFVLHSAAVKQADVTKSHMY